MEVTTDEKIPEEKYPGMQLKRISYKEVDGKLHFEKPYIIANGKKLWWADSVSFKRLTHYEVLSVTLPLGKSLEEIMESLKKIYNAANKQLFADVCVIAYNTSKGLAEMMNEDRIHPCFELVSMFLNYEDEDIRHVDRKLIAQKYEDICEEGYDPQDFFVLAMAFIPGFIAAYNNVIQGTFLKGKTNVSGSVK